MRIILILLLQLTGLEIFCQENYPIPVKDGKMLFYFQRSCNTNTIVYELNKLQNGSINNDNPIVEYWILYNKGGARLDLSFIQRTAFGLQSELLDKEKGNFILHFSRYKKRSLYLVNTEGKYKVFIDINGTPAELNKIFIKCENNILGFPTVIHYVEISGKDIKTGNPVSEKIKP